MIRHTGEGLIDVAVVAVAAVLSLQAACINGAEFDTPEADCFAAYGDAPLSK
jgi:hypothetical protein